MLLCITNFFSRFQNVIFVGNSIDNFGGEASLALSMMNQDLLNLFIPHIILEYFIIIIITVIIMNAYAVTR